MEKERVRITYHRLWLKHAGISADGQPFILRVSTGILLFITA